jgi:hypothetical protein
VTVEGWAMDNRKRHKRGIIRNRDRIILFMVRDYRDVKYIVVVQFCPASRKDKRFMVTSIYV